MIIKFKLIPFLCLWINCFGQREIGNIQVKELGKPIWIELDKPKVRGFIIEENFIDYLINKPNNTTHQFTPQINEIILAENIIKKVFTKESYNGVFLNFNKCPKKYRKIRKDIRLYYGFIDSNKEKFLTIYSYCYRLKKLPDIDNYNIGLKTYSMERRCVLSIIVNLSSENIETFTYF